MPDRSAGGGSGGGSGVWRSVLFFEALPALCGKKSIGIPGESRKPKEKETIMSGCHEHGGSGGHEGTKKITKAYFCPMCEGVEADGPGACPKCGMALERNPA